MNVRVWHNVCILHCRRNGPPYVVVHRIAWWRGRISFRQRPDVRASPESIAMTPAVFRLAVRTVCCWFETFRGETTPLFR